MVESSFNNDYYEDGSGNKSTIEKIKVSIGAISLTLSIIIFLSLLSYLFTGTLDQSLIERHKMVYKALGDLMKHEIHAFSMKTLTVQEWKDQ